MPDQEQAHIGHPNVTEKPKISGMLLRYVILYILSCFVICLYFYVINMADEEACEKKICQYGISFSPLRA